MWQTIIKFGGIREKKNNNSHVPQIRVQAS